MGWEISPNVHTLMGIKVLEKGGVKDDVLDVDPFVLTRIIPIFHCELIILRPTHQIAQTMDAFLKIRNILAVKQCEAEKTGNVTDKLGIPPGGASSRR